MIGSAGEVIERRLIWQGALDLLGAGPGAAIRPRSSKLLFNPLHLSTARPGTTLRYEFDIGGNTTAVTIKPRLCRTSAALRLPLQGRVLVLDGHDALSHHRRFNYLADWAKAEGLTDNVQRFALDLVAVDRSVRHFRAKGKRNEDFLGWGQPVRAPAAGMVVAASDGQPDNDQVGSENRWTGKSWESANGNYVTIRHNPSEYSAIAHLQQGSVTVKAGDMVRAGQVIGRVGNSGASLMPHVHYQLQDGQSHRGTHGLPAYFHVLQLLSGERVPRPGIVIDTGDVIAE